MAFDLENLQTASYNNIQFLVNDVVNDSFGRKTVTHEYPYSNNRYVEDLGKLEDTITFTAIITGDNYKAQRDALKTELGKGGRGLLIHPFQGSFNVVPKPSVIRESIKHLNTCYFDLTFEKSELNIYPTKSTSNKPLLLQQNKTTRDIISSTTQDNWNVTSTYSYDKSKEALNIIADLLNLAKNKIVQAIGSRGVFDTAIEDFIDKIISILNGTIDIDDSLDSLYEEIPNLSTPENNLFFVKQLWEKDNLQNILGLSVDNYPTVKIKEIDKNIRSVDLYNAIYSLTYGYDFISDITFNNDLDLENTVKQINEQLDFIFTYDLGIELRDALEDSRVLFSQYINEISLTTPKVITDNIKTQPLIVATYNKYGDIDNFDQLIDLNRIDNPSQVVGDINFITNVNATS